VIIILGIMSITANRHHDRKFTEGNSGPDVGNRTGECIGLGK
jgi:hypothetical protein